MPDLLDHLRAAFSPQAEISYDDLFEQVRNAPLLVLDELGSQSATPWAEEKLRQIVNHRFTADLPTVVTTTAKPHELDPYLRARLADPQSSVTVRTRLDSEPWRRRWGEIDPEMLHRMTFDTFDVRGNRAGHEESLSLKEALRASMNYAKAPDGWLTLYGRTGVGKTHLAVAIARERIKAGDKVFFAEVLELLDNLRSAFDRGSNVSFGELFEQVKSAPLLVLDGLGDESDSAWGQEKLFQIVVRRHNARLPTVMTANELFPRIRGAMGSRLRDSSLNLDMPIEAPDYRIRGPRG